MDKKEQPEPNPSKMTPEQRQLLREKAREVTDLWNRKFKPIVKAPKAIQ